VRRAATARLRQPGVGPPREIAPTKSTDEVELRLTLGQGALGLELVGSAALGPLAVTELRVRLSDVRFPVDLSGGVSRFRHRRGQLVALRLDAPLGPVARALAPRARNQIGAGVPAITLAPSQGGVMVGVAIDGAALAFDVLLAPNDGDLRLIPTRARGVGLDAPAHVVASRVLGTMLGSIAVRVGAAHVVSDVGARVARAILPDAGARAPSALGLRLMLGEDLELQRVSLEGRMDAAPQELGPRTLRALELAELCADAEVAELEGDIDGARRSYLVALERAPRHPDIAERLAAIDLVVGDRTEAALSTLTEARGAMDAGFVGASALAASGDTEGAYAAFASTASDEPFGPLAALAWLRAADLTSEPRARRDALDQALVRAPALASARWARLDSRLGLGDSKGALADAEHLEGAARGPEARYAVSLAAGRRFAARGFATLARIRFEKALVYRPDAADAVLGLAKALLELGKPARALDLFARAVALGDRYGRPSAEASLELARALVLVAGDRSAAIARAATISPDAPEAAAARLLEGRWRAELGDEPGASRALARLRELCELFGTEAEEARRDELSRLLVEASEIDSDRLRDLRAAERDLALAVRLSPRDREIARRLRAIATAPETEAAPPEAGASREPSPAGPSPTEVPPEPDDTESDVEWLTDALRANPRDEGVALRLAALLERLEMDLELLALLSARVEESSEAEAPRWVVARDRALERIADKANAAGRTDEASLYRSMRSVR